MNALTLPASASVLVASDMHLGNHDPATARYFLQALHTLLPGNSHLILLGDLFEAWPGDDCNDPIAECLIGALKRLSRQYSICVMVGNRDFLLDVPVPDNAGARFTQRTGSRLLTDPTVLTIGKPKTGKPRTAGAQRVLLMHGDSLCTDDSDYQQQRRQARDPQWQQAFMAQPLAQRQAIATRLRMQSSRDKQDKPIELMDVNQRAVDAAMTRADTGVLLHGHTHRPGHHQWATNDGERHRFVLPDWDAATQRGGCYRIDATGIHAVGVEMAASD